MYKIPAGGPPILVWRCETACTPKTVIPENNYFFEKQ